MRDMWPPPRVRGISPMRTPPGNPMKELLVLQGHSKRSTSAYLEVLRDRQLAHLEARSSLPGTERAHRQQREDLPKARERRNPASRAGPRVPPRGFEPRFPP